ncbi:MAG: hypothetical protein ACR2KJ_14195, partial [Jatrophihabitans sp.]
MSDQHVDDSSAPTEVPAETPAEALAEASVEGISDATDHIEPLAAHAPVKPDSPAFSEFAIKPAIVEALAGVGIVRTFAIQEMTLPIALGGADLIG